MNLIEPQTSVAPSTVILYLKELPAITQAAPVDVASVAVRLSDGREVVR